MEIPQAPFAFRPASYSASGKGTDRIEFLACGTGSISGTAKKNGNIALLESLTASPDGQLLTLSYSIYGADRIVANEIAIFERTESN